MSYPEAISVPRPCPSCGGKLQRTTVDPNKPLGMVSCLGCQYQKPMDVYMKDVQATNIAAAKVKREKAKAR